MRLKGISLLLTFLFVSPVLSCMDDPGLILCLETQEGEGLTIRDNSPSGLTGTLTGGPAWVDAPDPNYIEFTTHTTASMVNKTVSYPGTDNVCVFTPNSALFDWVDKPFVIALTIQAASHPIDKTRCFLVYGSDGAYGWFLDLNTSQRIRYYSAAVAGFDNGPFITDTNPHRLLVARDPGKKLYFYLDGERKVVGNDILNSGTVTSNVRLGCQHDVGSGDSWNGKAGQLAIYNRFPGVNSIDAFAYNEYIYWEGAN